MKKVIFVFALLCVLFAFVGCASDEVPEEEPVPEVPANKIDSPVLTPERQEPVVVPEQTIQEEPDATFITDWIDLVVDDDENDRKETFEKRFIRSITHFLLYRNYHVFSVFSNFPLDFRRIWNIM